MRQGLTGCASFQIDRTDVDNWKCLFWKDGAYRILVYPNGTSKAKPGIWRVCVVRCEVSLVSIPRALAAGPPWGHTINLEHSS
jgi:hypothetical protein